MINAVTNTMEQASDYRFPHVQLHAFNGHTIFNDGLLNVTHALVISRLNKPLGL